MILMILALQSTLSYKHGIKKATALLHKKKDDLSSDAADAGLVVGAPTPAAVA